MKRGVYLWLAIIMLFATALTAGCNMERTNLTLYGVNTGKSDCLVFCLPNGETLLVDTGLKKTYERVKAVLELAGVRKIDHLVLTHGHKDHIGGLQKLSEDYEIGVIYTNAYDTATYNDNERQTIFTAAKEWQRVEPAQAAADGSLEGHATRSFGEVQMDFLAPTRPYSDAEDDNNNSIVIRLRYGEVAFMLMGDATALLEAQLLALYDSQGLQADFLKAGRHGKDDANSQAFIEAVSPSIVYLTGNRADDKHSLNEDVCKRLEAAGATAYVNEGEHLAVRFDCDGATLSAGTYIYE